MAETSELTDKNERENMIAPNFPVPAIPKAPAGKLNRTTLRKSRLLDYWDENELRKQTGHRVEEWPLVALKELLDNSLDACEEAGVAPEITVTVDTSGIEIADNGPGIPLDTINGVLDPAVRTSSREAYVSPTRGAQGNALKTLIAMPFVLSGATRGRVDITTHDVRHEITSSVDAIRQEPVIARKMSSIPNVQSGTILKVWWPDSASSLKDAGARFVQLADDFSWLNPHLTLTLDWFGERCTDDATDPSWRKWTPSQPTSALWYAPKDFERLLCGYIAHDQEHGTDRYVRDLVKEFRDLTRSAKQKAVLEETGLAKTLLSSLADSNGLDRDVTFRLLQAMQAASKPVKPALLGIIGETHIRRRFEDLGCDMNWFRYRKVCEMDQAGLPTVYETAFAYQGDDCDDDRRTIVGVNWSPGIKNPFRSLNADYGDGLDALLEKQRAGSDTATVFVLHVAHPRVRRNDAGKTEVEMD